MSSRPLRILVVDDDPAMVGAITALVGTEGHQVITAYDGLTAVKRFRDEHPDLVLLDLAMPGPDGFNVAGQMRAVGQAPILVVSGESGEAAKVRALGLGADDYLTKPFAMMELLARIEALLRRTAAQPAQPRTPATPPDTYQFGSIRVDFRRTIVTRNNEPVNVSAREFKLLRYLIEHPGATVSRDELLNEVWGYNALTTTRTVDVHISSLRQKIEEDPRHPQSIVTIHGFGYKFVS